MGFGTTLVFLAESAPGSALNFSVSLFQDDVIERDEVVVIATTVSSPGVFISGERYSVAAINILDNEGRFFFFVNLSYLSQGRMCLCVQLSLFYAPPSLTWRMG